MAYSARWTKPERRISFLLAFFLLLVAHSPADAGPDRHEHETEHFVVIYPRCHADLVPHIADSAERAFSRLAPAFRYTPSEKIVIRTTDYSDYGSAGARTMPHNVIRLAIEPLEIAYETYVFDDRIRDLIGHELVHIIVNDLATGENAAGTRLPSKVAPDQDHPMSVLYSLLTSPNRYTPRWHQEGIAVFLSTWLSGGYGRTLGSFDEMYFRSLVLDSLPFAIPEELESAGEDTFLLGNLQYLYGARFVAHLAEVHGVAPVIEWYRSSGPGYEQSFRKTFGTTLETAWSDFVSAETGFQERNIVAVASSPLTTIRPLLRNPVGWVTQPHLDRAGHRILFGSHQSHRLTAINRLNLESRAIERIGSISTPSLTGLASTAFDAEQGFFFYTTNNNTLYRDVRVLDVESGESRILFENARVGQLTVSPTTRELWGVRHSTGRASLVYSEHPYETMQSAAVPFAYGDTVQHLALSPSGRFLAATLHQSTGRQAIVVGDVEQLKATRRFRYQVITEEGSPEFPSWSPDGTMLYWSAYTTGVSNVYRYRSDTGQVEALSNTLRGLFRPVHVDSETLFAFEFGPEGFTPVLIPNEPVERVPAIEYQGQAVLARNPELASWALSLEREDATTPATASDVRPYRGASRLQVDSLMPVVSGFQDRVILGVNARLTDPLSRHDLRFELGVSPFADRRQVHIRALYEYERKYRVVFDHNPSSFYDLFNQRSQGTAGTKVGLGHTKRWKLDRPHSVTQTSEVAFHTGVESIHDNLVPVATPTFLSFETSLHSRDVRRAIGGVDNESGTEWTGTLNALALDSRIVGGLHADWNWYSTVARPHNVFHLQLAAGYASAPRDLAIGQYYLGGFGNQLVENQEVKQFRDPLRFPGVPVYSLPAGGFAKAMVEHNLPPLRLDGARIGSHALSHVDASWFAQGLMLDAKAGRIGRNLGAQVNLVLEHWSNLESTVSAGVARAWLPGRDSWEWFVSIKLLRN